jgi:hypothetical protein
MIADRSPATSIVKYLAAGPCLQSMWTGNKSAFSPAKTARPRVSGCKTRFEILLIRMGAGDFEEVDPMTADNDFANPGRLR